MKEQGRSLLFHGRGSVTLWYGGHGDYPVAIAAIRHPPVAFPPLETGAYVGQTLPEEVKKKIAKEGARTIPGREHGGNCDVRSCAYLRGCHFLTCLNRSRICLGEYQLDVVINETFRLCVDSGSRCYFPVFIKGANLSVGDLHFSQGDVSLLATISDSFS